MRLPWIGVVMDKYFYYFCGVVLTTFQKILMDSLLFEK